MSVNILIDKGKEGSVYRIVTNVKIVIKKINNEYGDLYSFITKKIPAPEFICPLSKKVNSSNFNRFIDDLKYNLNM